MKYDKLKQLVGKVVSISPHATMGDGVPKYFVPAEGVPTNVVPVKSAPTNVVPTKPVPVKSAPTNVVPVKSVPTKPVPTNVVPTKPVPTKPVPVKSVPTKLVPTNHVPTFKSTEIELVTKDVKRLITSVEIDTTIDKSYLESLPKSEKLLYVANRGWRLNTELRGNQLYDYAVKYINRKKQRIYLGKTEI
jgi:hypothetical protein